MIEICLFICSTIYPGFSTQRRFSQSKGKNQKGR